MYKESGEFVDHVLVHCEFACHLWSLVFCSYFTKGCGICWLAGKGALVVTKVLIYGEQLLYASCRPFGENAANIYLKRLNTLLDLNFFFVCTVYDWMATLCTIGFTFLCAL